MSIQAVKYVLEKSEIYGQSRLVLLALAFHAGPSGLSWPSLETLRHETRIRKSELGNCLKVLLRSGEIEISEQGGPRRPTVYQLTMFLQSTNVGAPTIETPESDTEGNLRKSTVPAPNSASLRFPLIQRELVEVPTNTEGTVSGSHYIQREPKEAMKTAQWEPQGGPGVPFTVPTVVSGSHDSMYSNPSGDQLASLADEGARAPGTNPFLTFLDHYPRDHWGVTSDAHSAWLGLESPAGQMAEILAGLAAWKQSANWTEAGGRFIPHAKKFLAGRMWQQKPAKGGFANGNSGRHSRPSGAVPATPGKQWPQPRVVKTT